MRLRKTVALLFVLALVAAACSSDDGGGATTTAAAGEQFPPAAGALGGVLIAAGDSVQIRTLQTLSGANETLGVDQVRGVKLAIKDFGPVHGHAVDLGTEEDDLCNAEGGTAGAQAIVAQPDVLGVIGTTCSGAAVPAAQILSEKGIVLISGSNTSPSLTSDLEGNANSAWQPGYYRTAHNDLFQGAAAAQYAYDVLEVTKAAAIHDGDPYTEGLATAFANSFTELGGEVTVITAVNKGDTDMTPILTEVAQGGPEVIYFPIFHPEGDFIIQQARKVSGLEDVVLFAADGIFDNSGTLDLPESAGMYFSGPDLNFTNVGFTGVTSDQFNQEYEAEFGEPPISLFHSHTYDATMMLLHAIDLVGVDGPNGELWVDRQALRDALYATADFSGITGVLGCDEFGDCGAQKVAVFFHETAPSTVADTPQVATFDKDAGFQVVG